MKEGGQSMNQYLADKTPPVDVKYSVYEMEQVSAYAKAKKEKEDSQFMSDEEAEAKYQKNRKKELIKEKGKQILIITGSGILAALILLCGYITLFME